jgi:hypothetical protein
MSFHPPREEAIMFSDAMSGGLIGAIAAALVLVVVALARKPVKCAACNAEQPRFRKPTNTTQALWGGYTCAGCGAELDAKGRVRKPKA